MGQAIGTCYLPTVCLLHAAVRKNGCWGVKNPVRDASLVNTNGELSVMHYESHGEDVGSAIESWAAALGRAHFANY